MLKLTNQLFNWESVMATIAALPDPLQLLGQQRLANCPVALAEQAPNSLIRLLALSNYAAQILHQYPSILMKIISQQSFAKKPARADLIITLRQALATATDEKEAAYQLRLIRHQWMVALIWRDLCRQESDVTSAWQTASAVTELAEICLAETLTWLENYYAPRFGRAEPLVNQSMPQQMIILGMGKLGASELNLSSDIDLIFAYNTDGITQNGQQQLSHQVYFTKISQKLIELIDKVTAQGFVFRVDMRLRPYGKNAPLINSVPATLNYYQQQGRDWERLALLKARVVAGDLASGEYLVQQLQPFVYRHYVDYSMKTALRELYQRMIDQPHTLTNNIKNGFGGIREIEFLVAIRQIIHGGHALSLQTPSLRQALLRLTQLNYLTKELSDQLERDYLYLRDVEHLLQAINDQQTHDLPNDELNQIRIAFVFGMPTYQQFLQQMTFLRQRIHQFFIDSIEVAAPDQQLQFVDNNQVTLTEQGILTEKNLSKAFLEADIALTEEIKAQLEDLWQLKNKTQQSIAKQRLQTLLPVIIEACCYLYHPDLTNKDSSNSFLQMAAPLADTLRRLIKVLASVMRRSVYLTLLSENQAASYRLVHYCALSSWFCDQISTSPMLLNQLTQTNSVQAIVNRDCLKQQLQLQIRALPNVDQEQQLEVLCQFKQIQTLHIAMADIDGKLTLRQVSDALTDLAEIVIDEVVTLVWQQQAGEKFNNYQFVVVGYGKLGSREMAYYSDLDLVFIYQCPEANLDINQTDTALFFTRIGQKIIHLLTIQTVNGSLYEVDMRLRPSGNAGLLVTTLHAYQQYQQYRAWLWEHQALVKARVICGDDQLQQEFMAIRLRILQQERSREEMQRQIIIMRQKIQKEKLDNERNNYKFMVGGLVDIEFICQYYVLGYSYQKPQLAHCFDNWQILETIKQQQLLPSEIVIQLQEAYLYFRSLIHLEQLGRRINQNALLLDNYRAKIIYFWQLIFIYNK